MSLTKIKAILIMLLWAMMCLGAWVLVTSNKVAGGIILGVGFVLWCILSSVCSGPRWF